MQKKAKTEPGTSGQSERQVREGNILPDLSTIFFRYFALINRLTSRYINRVEDCTTENRDITTEDINNAKSEIIGHQQLL